LLNKTYEIAGLFHCHSGEIWGPLRTNLKSEMESIVLPIAIIISDQISEIAGKQQG